jgi:hypothetical protein
MIAHSLVVTAAISPGLLGATSAWARALLRVPGVTVLFYWSFASLR